MIRLTVSLGLKDLIVQELWPKLFGVAPDKVVQSLSFEDTLRLANTIFVVGEMYESGGYSIRLLCALKQCYPVRWYSSWRNEALLGELYNWVNMEQERFYAFNRARQMVSPLPGSLAIVIASCRHMPGRKLVSKNEELELYQYAFRVSSSLRALYGIRSIYKEIEGKEREVEELDAQIAEYIARSPTGTVEELDITPRCVAEPFAFDKETSNTDVSFVTATPEEVWNWVRLKAWDRIAELDPRFIIEVVTYDNALKACYCMLQATAQAQDYAVRVLYALRWGFCEQWCSDWHYDAFLGYACELTRRYEEQVSAYFQASHRVSTLPTELALALARCHFSPQSSVTAADAIEMLRDVVKAGPYVEVLLLLKRLYQSTCQNEEVAQVERALAAITDGGIQVPSLLPAFVAEDYEDLQTRSSETD